jgi:hypothetical protein
VPIVVSQALWVTLQSVVQTLSSLEEPTVRRQRLPPRVETQRPQHRHQADQHFGDTTTGSSCIDMYDSAASQIFGQFSDRGVIVITDK